jgi:hypothetical protein
VTGVRFMVDLRWQELIEVRVHRSSPWMLGEEEGLYGTSPAVAQSGGATDAAERRGVVATMI